MFQTLMSWFSTASSSWLKPAAAVIALAAAALLGYQYASNSYQADIAELHAEYATRAKENAQANQKLVQAYAQSYVEAIDALRVAENRRDSLAADAVGLRQQAARLQRRLSQASADSCRPCRALLSRCIGTLAEGAELAAEGADAFVRCAAEKDAVVKLR